MTDLPASALDVAGGGSCDAAARRRGRSRRRILDGEPAAVDVKVVRLKNVHASEGDGAVSVGMVFEGGNAAAQGVRPGDVVLATSATQSSTRFVLPVHRRGVGGRRGSVASEVGAVARRRVRAIGHARPSARIGRMCRLWYLHVVS